jgi:hypothetical protein
MRLAYKLVPLLMLVMTLPVLTAGAADTVNDRPTVVAPAPGRAILAAPVHVIDFPDAIPMHNMGIASDGAYYYTCNGGNAGAGQINTYDLSGAFVCAVACPLDMRAIFFSPLDSRL